MLFLLGGIPVYFRIHSSLNAQLIGKKDIEGFIKCISRCFFSFMLAVKIYVSDIFTLRSCYLKPLLV